MKRKRKNCIKNGVKGIKIASFKIINSIIFAQTAASLFAKGKMNLKAGEGVNDRNAQCIPMKNR